MQMSKIPISAKNSYLQIKPWSPPMFVKIVYQDIRSIRRGTEYRKQLGYNNFKPIFRNKQALKL